ncbi:MAG TPA: cytochrome C oxidase subunit IV family protein [Thermoplasmata archaeon]|nr:cytochrome C oxidase subunit IV family protein [Thermoplasmata archaeon]
MAIQTQTEGFATGVSKTIHGVRKPYLLVFVFLAVITIIEVQIPTFGTSIGLQKPEQIVFLMATAVAKASLVALYYMHLRYEPVVLRYLPLVPLGLVAILVLTLIA